MTLFQNWNLLVEVNEDLTHAAAMVEIPLGSTSKERAGALRMVLEKLNTNAAKLPTSWRRLQTELLADSDLLKIMAATIDKWQSQNRDLNGAESRQLREVVLAELFQTVIRNSANWWQFGNRHPDNRGGWWGYLFAHLGAQISRRANELFGGVLSEPPGPKPLNESDLKTWSALRLANRIEKNIGIALSPDATPEECRQAIGEIGCILGEFSVRIDKVDCDSVRYLGQSLAKMTVLPWPVLSRLEITANVQILLNTLTDPQQLNSVRRTSTSALETLVGALCEDSPQVEVTSLAAMIIGTLRAIYKDSQSPKWVRNECEGALKRLGKPLAT